MAKPRTSKKLTLVNDGGTFGMKPLKNTYVFLIGALLLIALGLWVGVAVFNEPDETPATIAYSDTTTIGELVMSGLVSSKAGQAIFTGKGACFTCHGISGRGDGPHGALFTRNPTDLTGSLRYLMDSDRFLVIKYGTNGGGMDSRSDLTSQEVWDVIAFLHELQDA